MRLERDELRYRALRALEDSADSCKGAPCDKALWLRFLLAWLFYESGGDPDKKWLFVTFWTAATRPIRCSFSL